MSDLGKAVFALGHSLAQQHISRRQAELDCQVDVIARALFAVTKALHPDSHADLEFDGLSSLDKMKLRDEAKAAVLRRDALGRCRAGAHTQSLVQQGVESEIGEDLDISGQLICEVAVRRTEHESIQQLAREYDRQWAVARG